MSGMTTKESNSHTSRETNSSHKATPQRKPSSTKSRKVAAPRKPSSMARARVTSAAAAESTSATAGRPSRPVNLSSDYNPTSFHAKQAKRQEKQDAADAEAAQVAAEKKEKADAQRREDAAKRKEKIARARFNADPTFDTSYVNDLPSVRDSAAVGSQSNSTAKKRTAKKQQSRKTNKHGKRFLDDDDEDDDDDEQVTPERSNAHRSKRARISRSSTRPSENSVHVATREGSSDESAMSSSTQNSVTVYSTTVDAVPAVTGGLFPFGTDGDASQKYHELQEQLFSESMAEFREKNPTRQVRKRSASEAQLTEPGEPLAKKLKESEEEAVLRSEVEQATDESMAEAKTFKQDEVMDSPDPSSADDKTPQVIDRATLVAHTHQAATGEDANATETEPTTKEEAESHSDEEKVTEEISKTDVASTNTSSEQNEHRDTAQGDNATSQTSDEESAESSSNQTAATKTKQPKASRSGKAKPISKTQNGQKRVKKNASTTTSGSATQTDTQPKTARKSKKNNAQNEVAEASKKPATKKSATKSAPKPQSKANVSAVNQQSAATQQPPQPRVTGPARFVLTSKEDVKKPAARNDPPQASTAGQQADLKKPLADKTNTNRQPAKSGPKSKPVPSTNRQLEAAEKQSTTTKSAASKKRSRAVDDEEEDDGAESAKKPATKQRTNPPSMSTPRQPDPDASAMPNPVRANRRRTADARAAEEALRPPQVRRLDDSHHVNFEDPNFGQPKPRVDDNTSGDAGSAEDAPASNGPQLQRRKKGVLYVNGEEKKKEKPAPRQKSEAALEQEAVKKFFM